MFRARGQIDLIDYQSSENKGYRFLFTYIDHGIKFCFCTPVPNKEVYLPITSRISVNAQHDEQLLTRNEDQQTLRAYVPDPNLPWDPDTYCAPCKAWWNG
eukprot:jgi/Tetstr1/441970/TSEL_030175.t1